MRHQFGKQAREELKLQGHDIPDNQQLQDYAISWLLKQEGVTCVLLGARRIEYAQRASALL